jgi:proteasome-associated ATPase
MQTEQLQKLLSGADMSLEEETAMAEAFLRANPRAALQLCQLLINQKGQIRSALGKAEVARAEAQAALERLQQPPLVVGFVLRAFAEGRVEVICGAQRLIVTVPPELDADTLVPGTEVCLNRELTVVVGRNDEPRRYGAVATISEVLGATVVLRGVGDEESVGTCVPALAQELRPGDRVVYDREVGVVLARLPRRDGQRYVLETAPTAGFADIGGLDDVIAEIRSLLDLHLRRSEVEQAYQLRLPKGLILLGPPGCGKTLIAGAIARYIADARADTRFLNVPPGALRGIYYGQTEQRISELFEIAGQAPGLVIMFFDELDTYGARGTGVGHDIDGRVLGTLLTSINGLGAPPNVLIVAATNRLDLCDSALVRNERLGDRVFRIPRPNRDGARQILSKYLRPSLPYRDIDAADVAAQEARAAAITDGAVSHLYAEHGGAPALAKVTFADGQQRDVAAREVVTGALLSSAVERAKHAAATRHTGPDDGLMLEDMLEALDDALEAEKEKLRSPHAARQLLDVPEVETIVRVELAPRRRRRHRYLRAAA